MKMHSLQVVLFSFLFVFPHIVFGQSAVKKNTPHGYDWLGRNRPSAPVWKDMADSLPLVRVEGNRFVNSDEDTILFRGISIADPDKLEQEGQWNKNLFVKAKEFGAMLVRIPVHPGAWRARTQEQYIPLLDQAVKWCTEEDLYVIIDWHSIGNLEQGLYEDPSYYTTLQETFNFWRAIARHFAGNNTVAFMELYNEPTSDFGQLGTLSWEKWKTINENLIRLIRANRCRSIPLVAGFDWAYDLNPLHYAPVNAQGIAYVVHPYPHKRTPPYEPKWDEDFGFSAEKYPIVATELGFTLGRGSMDDNIEYGRAIINFMEAKHISWVWWVFDPLWRPPMLKSWKTFEPTDNGLFFEEAVRGMVQKVDSVRAQ